MTHNMFEDDYEDIRLVTFDLTLTPKEIGMIAVAMRSWGRHLTKQKEALIKKHGDDFDSSDTDERIETYQNIQRKIRKAGFG